MALARPLLKFKSAESGNESAYLVPEGLEALENLSGRICPVVFIGDGRGGKSYLASRVLGVDGAFLSNDTCEPVTEGVDVAVVPLGPLLEDCGCAPAAGSASSPPPEVEHLLVLDCEGGNNAMAAIRTLVNVFGILVGTQIVFVANGMFSEQALQSLSAALAARSLVHVDCNSKHMDQRLTFVVNKNSLRYDAGTLEKALFQEQTDPGRREMREAIREAFPEREFQPVCFEGMPDFESNIGDLRSRIVTGRRPLEMAGAKVSGPQLRSLVEAITEEVQRTKSVSFPSMNRVVIFEGFLAPAVRRLVAKAKDQLPKIEDFIPDLPSRDVRQRALRDFDDFVAHVKHRPLVDEARTLLTDQVDALWAEIVRDNEAIGNEVMSIETETREVEVSKSQRLVGLPGLLQRVSVTQLTLAVETRAIVRRKRGGPPEYSPWDPTGSTVTRNEESAFEGVKELPVLQSRLWKKSPSVLRLMVRFAGGHQQQRECVLKDGHFMWWDPEAWKAGSEASGCLNFLLVRALVEADKSCPYSFTIRPATSDGWEDSTCFTGGDRREFHFDVVDEYNGVSRDEWVEKIAKHIEFGSQAGAQLGEDRVRRDIGVKRPKVADLYLAVKRQ